MNREEALRILAGLMARLREEFGIERAGVFGSVARNEAGGDSDVDIVVAMPPVDLFRMANLSATLEEAFGRRVDVVRYRPGMNPRLRKWIDREAAYVEA
jgi:predicted nucleotidyltransferase